MNSLILLNAGSIAVSITPEAIAHRDEVLSKLTAITAITSQQELDSAVLALQSAAAITRGAESDRQEVKAPILKVGRLIDSTAGEYVAPLTVKNGSVGRVTKLVGVFTAEQKRLAAEAGAERLAELQRIENERLEAEKKERERLAQIEREKHATIQATRDAENREQFEAAKKKCAELERQQSEVARQSQVFQQNQSVARFQAMSAPVTFIKPSGLSLSDKWKFEVLDIKALAAAREDLVTITPKTAEINRAIAGGKQISGLRIWKDTQSTIRT
jgi:hypothetical protein